MKHANALVWGNNESYQLGLGDAFLHAEYVRNPTKLNDNESGGWTQIACGAWHTVALSPNGEVFTWGYGDDGQLGHGDQKHRNVPTKVESLSKETIVKVACGDCHTAALTPTGKVLTWGLGDYGQLGHGDGEARSTPKKIEALDSEVVVDVICGSASTVALTSSGLVYFCGKNLLTERFVAPYRIMTPRIDQGISGKNIISISHAKKHAAYTTDTGELYTWGDGEYGKLGHGDTSNQSLPKRVDALSGVFCKEVHCGWQHTAVVTKEGKLYTFGGGNCGQLGHGDKKDKYLPTLVQALETIEIKHVQCVSFYDRHTTMALSTSGYVYEWGYIHYYYVLLPRLVEGLRECNVVQISCGGSHCTVLVDPSPSPIRQAQQLQFNNEGHHESDVTFMVENTPIYGSKDVLSRKSQYFEAMFRSNMRESIERVVVIPDISSVVFLKMLEYLCLDDFVLEDDMDLLLREELVALADMYLLDGLKLLCDQDL